jgi:hypothetical protein
MMLVILLAVFGLLGKILFPLTRLGLQLLGMPALI